jgi:uncharacterized membrane protein YcaP (DUF421 family)
MDQLRALIGPDTGEANLPQLCVRAALLFVFGVILIRIAGRRTFSRATPLDIVVALVVGSNLSRIMIGRAPFMGGLAATLVLVLLHRLFAMLTLRWSPLASWVKSEPAVLVRDGAVDEKALIRHGLSRSDLLEGLRLEQQDDPSAVRLATLEGGGRISVLPKEK